jgi:hypothetical protein
MTRYVVQWCIGDFGSRREHFDGWVPGLPLVAAVETHIIVEAVNEAEALDKAFEIGNRMAVDADGKSWSSNVRSASVSDVVLITEPFEVSKAYAVRHMGFENVDVNDVLATLSNGYAGLVEMGAAR